MVLLKSNLEGMDWSMVMCEEGILQSNEFREGLLKWMKKKEPLQARMSEWSKEQR